MTWFKVDDSFSDHPKLLGVLDARGGANAIVLWIRAGSWSAKHLTEGFIPDHILRSLGGKPAQAELLCRHFPPFKSGLWERVDGGYQFHDWLTYQPTKQDVTAQRERNREKQARYRDRKKAEKSAETSPPVTRCVTGNAVDHGDRSITPPPTRPDPLISGRARICGGDASAGSGASRAGSRPHRDSPIGHIVAGDPVSGRAWHDGVWEPRRRAVEAELGKRAGPLNVHPPTGERGKRDPLADLATFVAEVGSDTTLRVLEHRLRLTLAGRVPAGKYATSLWALEAVRLEADGEDSSVPNGWGSEWSA